MCVCVWLIEQHETGVLYSSDIIELLDSAVPTQFSMPGIHWGKHTLPTADAQSLNIMYLTSHDMVWYTQGVAQNSSTHCTVTKYTSTDLLHGCSTVPNGLGRGKL